MSSTIFKRFFNSGEHTYQTKDPRMGIILKRKILAAILSSLLFALFLSFDSFKMDDIFGFYYLNFMFAITYGVITSIFSDWFSKKTFKRVYIREIISFLFHCVFGIALTVLGLISAVSFFIVDRLLVKVKIEWLAVIMALIFVVLVYLIIMNL